MAATAEPTGTAKPTATATDDERVLRRRFVSAGTQLAASVFLIGLKGLVFLWALGDQPPAATAVYGTLLAAVGVAVVLVSGLELHVMSNCRGVAPGRVAMDPRSVQALGRAGSAAVAAALVLTVVLLAAGVIASALPTRTLAGLPSGDVMTYYWARIGPVALLPVTSLVSAVLVLAGREGLALRRAAENLALAVVASAALRWLDPSVAHALLLLGLIGALLDVHALLRPLLSLGTSRPVVVASLRFGVVHLCTAPRAAFRSMPQTMTAGVEAIVLATSFAAMTLLAVAAAPQTGAAVGALITVYRAVVVPLKSCAVVAARLALSPTGFVTLTAGQRMRTCRRAVAWLLYPLAGLLLTAPHVPAVLLGAAADTPGVATALRLLGVQLLLEPRTGCTAGALKVLVAATATLTAQMVSLWALALPVMLLLAATERLSLVTLWLTFLASRVIFCLQVGRLYRLWLDRQQLDGRRLGSVR